MASHMGNDTSSSVVGVKQSFAGGNNGQGMEQAVSVGGDVLDCEQLLSLDMRVRFALLPPWVVPFTGGVCLVLYDETFPVPSPRDCHSVCLRLVWF